MRVQSRLILDDLLMVPEKRELLLADLERAATVLSTQISISPSPSISSITFVCFTYLRYQHLIASTDAHRHPFAVPVHSTGSHSQHLCLIELLLRALGQEDAACGSGIGLHPLYEDAIEEGREGFDGFDGGRLGESH